MAESMWLMFGREGQLAQSIKSYCTRRELICLDLPDCDFTKPNQVIEQLKKHRPSAVINAAAYTKVDLAEKESDLAHQINAETPGKIAEFCADMGVPMMHYSTDYVYSGDGKRPWEEEDQTLPVNAYGRSKLAGEKAIQASGCLNLIFRTSWLYSSNGHNFFNSILKQATERESLQVVSDQVGAPTYCDYLAESSLYALEQAIQMPGFPSGIYNMACTGHTTWFEFAKLILSKAKERGIPLKCKGISPVTSDEYPTPAVRPKNSRLHLGKLENVFHISMHPWELGVADCVKKKVLSSENKSDGAGRPANHRA